MICVALRDRRPLSVSLSTYRKKSILLWKRKKIEILLFIDLMFMSNSNSDLELNRSCSSCEESHYLLST
jgi:hypothetical protein